jgi:secreted PhoX family phosphatase
MEMDGGEAKSKFGGSNKRARTAGGSEWDSQVFSDDAAEADVRTKLGAATLSGATRNARSAGMHTHPSKVYVYICRSMSKTSYSGLYISDPWGRHRVLNE